MAPRQTNPRIDELRADLLQFSGGGRYLTVTDVARYMGLNDRKRVAAFLRDCPYLERGKRHTFHVTDVANLLYRAEVRG